MFRVRELILLLLIRHMQSQRLSVAVHIASAWEIATEMQLAGGGGEAPSSAEEGGATA